MSWFFHLLDRRHPASDLIRRGKIQNLALVSFVTVSDSQGSRLRPSGLPCARRSRSAQESILLALPSEVKDFFREILGPLGAPGSQENAPFGAETPCMSTTTYPPTDYTAVLSAMAGLTAEFGMGSGGPLPPWSRPCRALIRDMHAHILQGPPLPGALAAA